MNEPFDVTLAFEDSLKQEVQTSSLGGQLQESEEKIVMNGIL